MAVIVSRKQAVNRVEGQNTVVAVHQRCVNMAVEDRHVVGGVMEHFSSEECRNEGNG